MDKVLLNSQMRTADEYTINEEEIPSQILMLRAGQCIAEEVIKVYEKLTCRTITVVCGTGNNGGDGYVCAEELIKSGFPVKVYAFEGNLSKGCAEAKSAYSGDYTHDVTADIIVDCIFGTGLSCNVTGTFAELIQKINSSGAFVISADIPSGLNGDNGRVCGCAVKAGLTVAIAEYKAGMFLNDGLDFCGKVVKRDIGIVCPENKYIRLCSDADIKKFYPERRRNSHKGTYGSANIVAGRDSFIGAAALAVEAALRSGCGYVKLTSTEKVKLALSAKLPQAIYIDKPELSSQAIAIGMGCGVSESLYENIKLLLTEYTGTLIIDADGLNTLAKYGSHILKNKSCRVILTPHVKEFARLTELNVSEILDEPVKYSEEYALEYGVVLLLKGAASIITDGKATVINTRGTTALSKGGSGDMLSGYMCGCAARGLEPFEAAVCSAYTIGVSAELSSEQKTDYCATAKDILKNLHSAVKQLTD